MNLNALHADGRKATIDVVLEEYRNKLVRKHGNSFLIRIWISWLVSQKKYSFYHNLEELESLYLR